RSRYYEEWKDGDWHVDGTADLGRIKRQQLFIRSAVEKLLGEMESDPFKVGQLVGVATSVVTVDQGLDPIKAAAALRQAAAVGLSTYSLPVVGAEHKGQSALDLDEAKAQPILDYFRGAGPQPPHQAPTTTAGGCPRSHRRPTSTLRDREGVDPRRRRRDAPAPDHPHQRQAAGAGGEHADPVLRGALAGV